MIKVDKLHVAERIVVLEIQYPRAWVKNDNLVWRIYTRRDEQVEGHVLVAVRCIDRDLLLTPVLDSCGTFSGFAFRLLSREPSRVIFRAKLMQNGSPGWVAITCRILPSKELTRPSGIGRHCVYVTEAQLKPGLCNGTVTGQRHCD